MWHLLNTNTADLTPRPDHIESKLPCIRMSHALNHNICPTTSRNLLHLRHRIIIEINRLDSKLRRLLQPLRHRVDRNNIVHHRQRTSHRTDTYGPATDTDDRELLPIPIRKILQESRSSEVASRKDIRHEHQHLLRNTLRCLHKGGIGQWTPHVLRLSSINCICRSAVSEQLALAAPRSLTSDAVETLSARGIEGYNNLITNIEILDIISFLDDLANELVPADEVGRAFEVAAVEVQVGAAEGGGGDFEDGVGGFLDLGDGAVFYFDLYKLSVPTRCRGGKVRGGHGNRP